MTIYLFGKFTNGYTQYPNDDTRYFLESISSSAQANTQIVIHRDGNFMYYCYIRNLIDQKYIGICILTTDKFFTKIDALFPIFETLIEKLSKRGNLVHFNDYGLLTTSLSKINSQTEDAKLAATDIEEELAKILPTQKTLPPIDFSISKDSINYYCITDDIREIVKSSYTFGYTVILKEKDYDTIKFNSYSGVLSRISKERDNYAQQLSEKKKEISKLKAKQRNMTWVGILGIVVLILGVIIWNKVLFPSEVTHYETGEFIYYGPMKNKKPHGVGVAIYPTDDTDGRKYYIGNFVEGERQDSLAILFYQDGDYFYGNMEGDKWKNGLFYRQSDGTYFTGTFDDENNPYDGEWYDHVIKHHSIKGEPVYGVK